MTLQLRLLLLIFRQMRGLYEGGQCNPNSISATSNQYKRMMDSMAIGGQNPQKVMRHTDGGQNLQQQIMARQAMFQQMNQTWAGSKLEMQALNHQMDGLMSEGYMQAHSNLELQARNQEMSWIQAQQQMMARERIMGQQYKQAEMQRQAQIWQNQLEMDRVYSQAKVTKEQEQASIMKSSESMLETMMSDPDPRFQNSEFLHFLKQIQNKQLIIQGQEIHQNNPVQQTMQKSWENAEKEYHTQQAKMQQSYKTAENQQQIEQQRVQGSLQDNWQKRLEEFEQEYKDHDNFQKMLQSKYMQVLKEMNIDMTEAWQSATDLEEDLVHGEIRENYAFQENNPFLQANNKKALALDFINKGMNNEAILALEAQVQKNEQDSESWRILGRILQQNDQDQKSITCFTNSLKHNPENLDSLLSLGVSCTNILDQVKAMNYLKQWIILNPKYKHMNIDPNIIPDTETNLFTYKIEQIKEMNNRLIAVFENALLQGPKNDPQLFNSLAILYFIKREYERSIDLFQHALTLDPTNYLLMNKIGAALAHLGRSEEAIQYYHNALDLRPNYVRVWVNLGIAHGFKGNYEEAARFYLNSLSFRPDAKHIWSYLHNTFVNMQRYDLIPKISTQNSQSFQEFDVIDLKQLPAPALPYQVSTERHILNKISDAWLQETPRKNQ